ncbi:hypothetical protein JFU37_29635 [Pseudomonas sp. TH41]|uniref:hypothetical protein n=1 Tax=Pseudomonas sp. TH41 TaxID=2796405 RepID=UPI0019148D68|nr:hypothetical protein [Pseudomonas sp. TH41]MBK5356613.1 hypothetical protein [Pseudomonas sp. TH41]
MADDQQAKQHSELLGALQGIQGSLKALATIQLSAEFYTPHERRALRAEYDVLREKDSAALAAVQQAREDVFDPGLSWDQRIQKYGERTARQHLADVRACEELRSAAYKDVVSFERKHPLLMRLVDSAAELGKGKYE